MLVNNLIGVANVGLEKKRIDKSQNTDINERILELWKENEAAMDDYATGSESVAN